ncbi:MAG: alpha/beta hydrolase [Clostridia bacterium]
MIHETFLLKDSFDTIDGGELETYILDNYDDIDANRVRPAIVILPGGGYNFLSVREKEPFAVRFLAQGYHAFVLNYSLAPIRYPTQLIETAAAIAFIRSHSKEWHVDPNAITVCGFSAGGHLAANISTMWNRPFLSDKLGVNSEALRPNAAILAYPVITSGEFAHRYSFDCLIGDNPSVALLAEVSLENTVGPHTPQTFLWHTVEDPVVPVENSFLYADALRKNNIPFEMHIFPNGRHGLGLCNYETASPGDTGACVPHTEQWFQLCCRWLESIFPPNMGA